MIERGMFAMSNFKYSEFYGRLDYLPTKDYYRGEWEYVASEELDMDGKLWDIVRSPDNTDWRYTLV